MRPAQTQAVGWARPRPTHLEFETARPSPSQPGRLCAAAHRPAGVGRRIVWSPHTLPHPRPGGNRTSGKSASRARAQHDTRGRSLHLRSSQHPRLSSRISSLHSASLITNRSAGAFASSDGASWQAQACVSTDVTNIRLVEHDSCTNALLEINTLTDKDRSEKR